MSKKEKEHPILNYPRTAGKCPKCAHWTVKAQQWGSMPPGEHCLICGWHDFDMAAMVQPDWETMPDTRRPM